MLIGYARVSSQEQNLDLQKDALIRAGCEPDYIFSEKISSAKEKRPELEKALSQLRKEDTLIVWRLDRLGRSSSELIKLIEVLKKKGVQFKSLTEAIDTNTASGQMIYGIIAVLAEFERNIIRERTRAGLESARARGRLGGRKPTHSDRLIEYAREEARTTDKTIKQICQECGISRHTYYNRLRKEEK